MRQSGIAAMLAALLWGTGAVACDLPANAAATEQEIATWINAERGAEGLGPLRLSPALEAAAAAHACGMAARNDLSHKGFSARLRKAGYRASTAVENVGRTKGVAVTAAARMWRNSPGHRDNILNRKIREMGVAVATDGTSVWYVFIGGASG
ncbi:CAP domain-containing protein [Neotabrizicola sp. VNH66]|uniref:CAP domain-containing protein n=1 Tax=Neotabrizicola sp. VNH66 TaxID=3400918 RepID=UPI003BFA8DC2